MQSGKERAHRVLSDAEKEQFVRDGFVKLENAFPPEIAAAARAILWCAVDCDPEQSEIERTSIADAVSVLGCQRPRRTDANSAGIASADSSVTGSRGRRRLVDD